jgi:hypothetical protein
MGAIVNGMGLHNSGLIHYCATFYIFTDYMRSAMRMSALSEVRPDVGWPQEVSAAMDSCCCGQRSGLDTEQLAVGPPEGSCVYTATSNKHIFTLGFQMWPKAA